MRPCLFKAGFESALFSDLNDVQHLINLLNFTLELAELLISDDDCSCMLLILIH